jgi:arabinofuranan 3-O-arabinosyltransferase
MSTTSPTSTGSQPSKTSQPSASWELSASSKLSGTPGPAAQAATSEGTLPAGVLDPVTAARVRRRMHLIAVSVALVVLAFIQQPGRIVSDTKADLTIDPVHFLLTAAHLWNPSADSGQLQNQAYGYFLPMGPFFAIGHLLRIPAWVIQRAWWALVLLVAFHGLYRLCRRLGIGSHAVAIIAALAFALSPRMVTELGPVSVEVWPTAVAPWVLLPLIKVRAGRELRAAARSGLALAFCGGVNAVAVGAVLPLPIWWLITREPGRLRRRLSAWWALAVVLATFWWVGPLLLLGRYSPPFLDWIESSAVTTSKASLPSAFRGTTQWVAWLRTPQPIWLAGWSVLSSPAGILLSWLLLTVSVLALSHRDMPNRRFLIGATVGGLLLVTVGHTGPLTAAWAGSLQGFLDGAGAALRNTHKFDVILRLPLSLALAHGLSSLRIPDVHLPGWSTGRSTSRRVPGRTLLCVVAAFAVVGGAAPALVGQLPEAGSYQSIPSAWEQAATWLKQHDDGNRTLIVPGSPFATSAWGDPRDEPFQALARTEWATRSVVPLSSAGNIRMLDVVEQQLATGRGSPGLAQFLARAGISKVLLRADLARATGPGAVPLPVTVHSALTESTGLSQVAAFGPEVGAGRTPTQVVDDGVDVRQREIEIWQVNVATAPVEVAPADDALRVAGGPEGLLALAEAGLLSDRPTVLNDDPQATALGSAPMVETDTIQRREANFAAVDDNYSEPMTAAAPFLQQRSVHDWLPFRTPLVTARYTGISSVTTSSQASSAQDGWQALDGDPVSAWTSGVFSVGQWLDLSFSRRISLTGPVLFTPGPNGARITQVQIRTDAGTATSSIDPAAGPAQPLTVPAGATRMLWLTVTKVVPGDDELAPASIAQLTLPELKIGRDLVLPPIGSTTPPQTISLENARDGVDTCVFATRDAVCSPRLQEQSEDTDLNRVVQLTVGGTYRIQATARIRAATPDDSGPDSGQSSGQNDSALLASLLQPAHAMTATSSSRLAGDPVLRPGAAIDRDPGTAWLASASDTHPTLTVSWPQSTVIDRLRWQLDPSVAASRPAALTIVGGGKSQTVTPDADGWVSFHAIRTNRIAITVAKVAPLLSFDSSTGFVSPLPTGASEIVIPGADAYRQALDGNRRIEPKCGSGTPLTIGDRVIPTRLSGTVNQVLHRLPMSILPCGPVPAVAAGVVPLRLKSTSLLEPQQLTLTLASAAAGQPSSTQQTGTQQTETQQTGTGQTGTGQTMTAPQRLVEKGPEHRIVTLAGSSTSQLLIVHENLNPGWRATMHGHVLRTVRIDGWQQGWIVPAGPAGTVDLRFTPGNSYRLTLAIGLAFVLVLLMVVLGDRLRSARLKSGNPAAVRVLPEARGTVVDSALGVGAVALLGGLWALPGFAVILLVKWGRVSLPMLTGIACVGAGISATFSLNADGTGFFSVLSIACALLLVICLVVGLRQRAGGHPGDQPPPGDTTKVP